MAAASAALERAQQPIERLGRLISDHEARERRLAQLKEADEQARVERLLSDSIDETGGAIMAPPVIAEIEHELQVGAADAAAAKKALDSLQPEYARAADRVRQASQHRDEAVFAAALAASRSYIAMKFVPAIQRCLEIEANLRSVETALRTRGASEPVSTAALAAAATLAEEITRVRREATKMADLAPGRRLLEQLMTDPRAEL